MLQKIVDTDTTGLCINIDASIKVRSQKRAKCSKMDLQMEKTNWET
jgi:hypothetical protein